MPTTTRSTRYSKYESTLDDIDTSSLMEMIRDSIIGSAFNNPYDPDPNSGQSMDELREAILQALMDRDLIPDDMLKEAQAPKILTKPDFRKKFPK